MRRWLWIILAAELLLLGVAEKCAFEPALADTLQDTNPADIQAWYRSLDNHIGGSCCGEGDGYPAAIDVEALPGKPGRGHVTDPSEKEIVVDGRHIKTRVKITGKLTFEFDWNHVAKEKHGNPFNHAVAFVSVQGGQIISVYCVVLQPAGV